MKVYVREQNVKVHHINCDTTCTDKDTTIGIPVDSAGILVIVQVSGVLTITTLGVVDDLMMDVVWSCLSVLYAQH